MSIIHKHEQGFSLLELMVSLAIISVIMLMFSNIIVNSISISQRSLARSFVREEIATLVDAIVSDLRSANTVGVCEGTLDQASCSFVSDSPYTWEVCPGETSGQRRICKKDVSGQSVFIGSENINITHFSFDIGFELGGSSARRNIIITVVGDHLQEGLNIKNVLRQTSVSTRNYLIL